MKDRGESGDADKTVVQQLVVVEVLDFSSIAEGVVRHPLNVVALAFSRVINVTIVVRTSR